MSRLKKLYDEQLRGEVFKEMKYSNIMQTPKIKKVVLNISLSEALKNIKVLENAANDLTAIGGQKPVMRRAKKSIAGFKLREGSMIGVSVTLRGEKMYCFLDRLINTALPRSRDFRGVSGKAFDKGGNFNLGLKEQTIFPELDYDKIDKARGMNITVCISGNSVEGSRLLLTKMNMPFIK